MKQAVIANSNIKETLDTYPELRQVLIDLSPKFKRMQNVAVYNTLARFANFNDAAKITGLSVCEILHTINRHLGTEDILTEDMPQCINVDSADTLDNSVELTWAEGPDRYIYSDKSMSSLIQKVIDLAPQECLVIISVERPNELLKVINGLGYAYNTEYHREYRISIFNTSPAVKTDSWFSLTNNYDVLDVRAGIENPFDAILEKAKTIDINDGFILIQKFEPVPMINMLVEMGFEYISEELPDNGYKIYFHRTSAGSSSEVE